jgi:pimeloyl-ACP methyl ester carboxylesterase
MATLAHRKSGSGPDVVVIIHGVGVDARSFESVVARLTAHHTVVVPDRRGYGASAHVPVAPLATQVDDVRELITSLAGDARSARPTVATVGVSGGATLALALAVHQANRGEPPIGPVLVHEPLVGELAPDLARRVRESYARTLATDPTLAGRYLRELIGSDTWARLGAEAHARIAGRAWVVAAEVPSFLSFRPTWADLRRLRDRDVIVSIGARSAAPRWEAADVLSLALARPPLVVDGAGHLPQVDAPDRFAELILDTLRPNPGGETSSTLECPA